MCVRNCVQMSDECECNVWCMRDRIDKESKKENVQGEFTLKVVIRIGDDEFFWVGYAQGLGPG